MPENFIFVLIEKLWLFENNGIGKEEEQQKLETRKTEGGERGKELENEEHMIHMNA